jgi:hypothetical protein
LNAYEKQQIEINSHKKSSNLFEDALCDTILQSLVQGIFVPALREIHIEFSNAVLLDCLEGGTTTLLEGDNGFLGFVFVTSKPTDKSTGPIHHFFNNFLLLLFIERVQLWQRWK